MSISLRSLSPRSVRPSLPSPLRLRGPTASLSSPPSNNRRLPPSLHISNLMAWLSAQKAPTGMGWKRLLRRSLGRAEGKSRAGWRARPRIYIECWCGSMGPHVCAGDGLACDWTRARPVWVSKMSRDTSQAARGTADGPVEETLPYDDGPAPKRTRLSHPYFSKPFSFSIFFPKSTHTHTQL